MDSENPEADDILLQLTAPYRCKSLSTPYVGQIYPAGTSNPGIDMEACLEAYLVPNCLEVCGSQFRETTGYRVRWANGAYQLSMDDSIATGLSSGLAELMQTVLTAAASSAPEAGGSGGFFLHRVEYPPPAELRDPLEPTVKIEWIWRPNIAVAAAPVPTVLLFEGHDDARTCTEVSWDKVVFTR